MDSTPELRLIEAMAVVRSHIGGGLYDVPYTVALRELVAAVVEVSEERAFPLSDVFGESARKILGN